MSDNPGAYSDGSYYHPRESGDYHYVEMFDTRGVYLRSCCATRKEAMKTATRYQRNGQAAADRGQPIAQGHGVRAVTETVTRKVY